MKLIPYGGQKIESHDASIVSKSLLQKLITSGPSVQKFEKKINNFLSCKYSTVCSSGTSALFLAMKALDIKKNDIILMPSINFISSYNIAKILGAKVFLTDVDELTGQITPKLVEECCRKYKIKKFDLLIVMYNGGYPLNANNYIKLKKKYRCNILEDACHALGAEYLNKKKFKKIGSCFDSDVSIFSLHPLKTITTGEGGIVTTNNKKIDKLVKSLRSHGITRSKTKHWEYDVLHNSLNFRLTDFQCDLGINQLLKIKKFIKKRKKIADYYEKKLKKLSEYVHIKTEYKSHKPAYHLILINIKNCNLKKKEKLLKFMQKNNINLQYHYIPIYKFKVFKDKYIKGQNEKYFNSTVSLPVYVDLTFKQINFILSKLNIFFKLYS
jgi:dTDP-4-amino-4,6-dideoxygalactose transaminase